MAPHIVMFFSDSDETIYGSILKIFVETRHTETLVYSEKASFNGVKIQHQISNAN